MADCIDLDDFTLSSPNLGLSLSVSSHLYTTQHFTEGTTCEDVRHLVQSGELGFLPPTVCHLQIIVLFAGSPAEETDPGMGFLEFLGQSICSTELWQRLGLAIECTKVQYETETPDTPNLYFEMEHPDKSEALLSPACMITPCIDGLVCRFDFNSHHHQGERGRQRLRSNHMGGPGTRRTRPQRSISPTTRQTRTDQGEPLEPPNQAQHKLDDVSQQRRKCTALLAIAALYKITGIGARFLGVRGMTPDSTALLDLAPAVCNAHYMKSLAAHCRSFALISDVLLQAATWRPSLQDKVSALVANHEPVLGVDGNPDDETPSPCQIQKRLWLLTQSSLDAKTKTIGQQNICAATEAMISELEMSFFSDGPSVDLPDSDGAQSLHDIYDDWASTHNNPRQLCEGDFGSNLEMLERGRTHWREVDHEWGLFEDHVYNSQLGEMCQIDQDWGREDLMSTL